ncbi:hypothetical protein CVS40_8608 [Lucilia cuprina]|nr:hypothetical protein CVS40_8608 [Lucilia cuprina]
MATTEQKKSFIGMCASIIRDNYDDPLSLDSFLNKIDLIEELTEPNLTTNFVHFIKSKLEAKAREALPDNVTTIDEIKTALKTNIKPDSSKVIAGKISALTVKNDNFADFSKQAELLADAFKRSLTVEGITKKKAHEMAVEQTVAMCRLNAKSDLVKSILASSSFSDPTEVIAKQSVEQAAETKERHVLAFRNQGSYRTNSYQNKNFPRFRNNYYRDSNRRYFNNNYNNNFRRNNNFANNQNNNNYRRNGRNG